MIRPSKMDLMRSISRVVSENLKKSFCQKLKTLFPSLLVLHNVELNIKHQTPKFGLGLLFNLTPLLNHCDTNEDDAVLSAMNVSRRIEALKQNLRENPRYLQEKVQEYFKDNKHKLTLTMSPDPDYENQFLEIEQKNLQEKVAQLTEEDKERIYKDGLALEEAQKSKDDVNCLPCLKLEDIKDLEKVHLEFKTVQKVPLQLCKVDTNGIVYFRGIFDASELSESERNLLPLFTQICDQFGTRNQNFRDFDNLVTAKTSGLSFKTHISENVRDSRLYEFGLEFGTYCLKENAKDMFQILRDLLCNLEFQDLQRFEMLLENYMSELSVGIAQSGHLYAIQNASGLITESSRLKENLSGIEHLRYMKQLVKTKSPQEILEDIKNIQRKVFLQTPARCALNVSIEDQQSALGNLEEFLGSLPRDNFSHPVKWNGSKILKSSARHNIMNIPVNYCAKSLVTCPYTNKDYAPLRVLAKLLSSKYLLPTVREQNGAYGAGSKISSDGIFSFFSYRDPNTKKTLDTFDESLDWFKKSLKAKVLDQQTLFEAKLGVLQQLDQPISSQSKGIENFISGISADIFAKQRKEVLETKMKDLERVSLKYLATDGKIVSGKSVIGPASEELTKMQREENWNIVNEN